MLRVVSKRVVSKGLQKVCSLSRSSSYSAARTFSSSIGDVIKVQDTKKSDEQTNNTHPTPTTNINDLKLALFHDINKSILSVDLDNVTIKLQDAFIAMIFQELVNVIAKGQIEKITFNNASESVFRYKLNMQLRRLGATSEFQRYNHDRGLATFEFQQ